MNRLSFSSLRIRLILLVLLAVIPALVLTFYTGLEHRRHVAEHVQNDALQLARSVSAEQERMIEGAHQFLYTLAHLPQVRKYDKGACSTLFNNLLKQYPHYLNIGTAEINGNVLSSAIPTTQAVNIADRLYFQQAVKTRNFAIGEYQIGRITGKPSLNLGYPVIEEAGRLKAVIFVALDLTWLNQVVAQARLPEGSTLLVIDTNGKILATYPEPEKWVGKTIPDSSIIKAILARNEGMTETVGLDGIRRLYAYTSLGKTGPSSGKICVSVGIPTSVAFGQVNRIQIRNLTLLGLVALLALLAAWVVGDLLVFRRVNPLINAANRISTGDLSARTGILYGKGELSSLAQTFDEMAKSLERQEAERRLAEEALRESEEAAKRLAQENATVAEIGRIVSSTLNIEDVYEHFAEEVHKLIPFDRIAINIINHEERTFTIAYTAGVEIPERPKGETPPLAGSFTEEVMRTRKSQLIQEEEKEIVSRLPGLLSSVKIGLRSMLSVPLISKDQVIGVLHLRSKKENAYTERDLRLAERVANQIAGAIANSQLFAEHKRTEEALRESEERFRDLYDNAPLGYHEYDAEGRITNVNQTDLDMLGYSREEMVGQYMWKFNIEEEIVHEQILEKLAGKRPPGRSLERAYRRKDGTTFPVLIEDRLILDEKGHIKGIRCTIQDITGIKQAEEALQRSEETATQLAQENAVVAEIGRIISSTLNIEEVYERFAEEVRKLIPFDRIIINIVNPEDDTQTIAYISGVDVEGRRFGDIIPLFGTATGECIRTQSSFLFQTESIDEVTNRFPGLLPTFKAGLRSMIFVPLISKDQVIGVLSLRAAKPNAYTEADLKLAEKVGNQIAGAIANAQLFAERVRAEQKAKSLEEQLRQSQKIEAIGRLAGGIAHDFNNLLTVIKGYSQLSLLKLKEGDPLKGDIEEIQRASQRATDLTRQLLAFSRRQILEFKILDLNIILQDLDKMLHRLIGEDIELVYLLSDDLGKVKTDPVQIEQVILNLAVNARDAMPSGGKLTIETTNVVLDETYARSHVGVKLGRYVMLSMSDSGCGMSPEVKEHIFEPFFTTKEKDKGTGLGLSTVYGIVKQSGGDIWFYSEQGQGTTFKIYLPRVDETLKEWKEKVTRKEFPLGSETILVVEDDLSVRGLAVRVLQRQGYTVLEASNGDEALRVVQENAGKNIHLLLTDVVMPGMSGSELAERLRSFHDAEIRVLYMSGYTDNSIVNHGILEPGINFLQKPFPPEVLARKVRDVLDK